MSDGATKKKILFIDFNGVLSYRPYWFSLQDEAHPLHIVGNAIEEYLFKKNPAVVRDWMLGRHTSEDIHDLIYENLRVPFDKSELFEIFRNDCINLDVSEEILSVLESLKSEYSIVLMTDNMDAFSRFTLPANPRMNTVFDAIHNSAISGFSKRDNDCEMFRSYLTKYGAEPSSSVFLDDSLKNCTAFVESIGGTAIRVDSVEKVIEALVRV